MVEGGRINNILIILKYQFDLSMRENSFEIFSAITASAAVRDRVREELEKNRRVHLPGPSFSNTDRRCIPGKRI